MNQSETGKLAEVSVRPRTEDENPRRKIDALCFLHREYYHISRPTGGTMQNQYERLGNVMWFEFPCNNEIKVSIHSWIKYGNILYTFRQVNIWNCRTTGTGKRKMIYQSLTIRRRTLRTNRCRMVQHFLNKYWQTSSAITILLKWYSRKTEQSKAS